MNANKKAPHNLLGRKARELPVKVVMTVLLSMIAVMMIVPFMSNGNRQAPLPDYLAGSIDCRSGGFLMRLPSAVSPYASN